MPDFARVPVTPVKGQMLALAMTTAFVSRTVWVPGAYLVPRDDGRLLIGATVEDAGFDVRVTAEENVYPMIAPGQPARDMVG